MEVKKLPHVETGKSYWNKYFSFVIRSKRSATLGIPNRSPMQVLSEPNRAWLRWSDENRYFHGGMVADDDSFLTFYGKKFNFYVKHYTYLRRWMKRHMIWVKIMRLRHNNQWCYLQLKILKWKIAIKHSILFWLLIIGEGPGEIDVKNHENPLYLHIGSSESVFNWRFV